MSDLVTRVRELGNLFWRSARDTGEAAAEGIEQHVQIQRLAGRVRRLDRERSDLIRQIGAKVYGLHGQGKIRNQDVLVDCRRIDQIIADIGSLKEEIAQIRAASLEKGITIPVMSDEAPLDEPEPVAATPATPAAEPAPCAEPEPCTKTMEPVAGEPAPCDAAPCCAEAGKADEAPAASPGTAE